MRVMIGQRPPDSSMTSDYDTLQYIPIQCLPIHIIRPPFTATINIVAVTATIGKACIGLKLLANLNAPLRDSGIALLSGGDLSSSMFSVALRADDTLAVLVTDLLIINSILVLSGSGWGSFNESCLRWLVNRTDRSSIKPSTGSAIESNVAAAIDL
ncbi:hypothetical protein CEXT_148291 [Caerostris extrusa]|uniref:Uncharacterized protein n=1 Tax=Caerostris extrusa TaxID=172846 RepID=A0AAV4TUX5_CAEEX|nr:hypothetical protein CEXT_148291 [Caerostris extrusa]